MHSGMFIAFEGLDGCGKSTQIHRVSAALRALGHDVHVTAEPSHGSIGTLIRQQGLCAPTTASSMPSTPSTGSTDSTAPHAFDEATLALLFAADRLHHVQHEIEPALAAGKIVLTDRYVLSSLAYQSVHLPMDWVMQINAHARHADATLFFHITPETAAQRRHARNSEGSRFETTARQRAVAAAFDQAMARYGQGDTALLGRCAVIDASPAEAIITEHAVHMIAACWTEHKKSMPHDACV